MICDDALVAVSERADGELPEAGAEALEAHLATCPACRGFDDHVHVLRSRLRFEPVAEAPDVAPAVLASLNAHGVLQRRQNAGGSRRRTLVAAAVAAVAGLVAGATFVGFGPSPRSPAAAGVPARVVDAQRAVQSLDARFRLTESGTPAGGGSGRSFAGHLAYRAPESLALTLDEDGGGAARARLVVDRDRWWRQTTRPCSPAAGLVRCPAEPATATRAVTDREPFSAASPVPLELVTPVDSFTLAATPDGLGARTVAGRPAVGVRVTAAQVAPFLAGLGAGIDLRPAHPADPVDVWLDDHDLVPLEVVVRAGDDPGRARWARAQGVYDPPGGVVIRFTVTALAVNAGVPVDAFAAPAGPASAGDEGFHPAAGGGGGGPGPAHLPAGFHPYRAGTVTTPGGPAVSVQSWTDGRAWLTVRSTRAWPGGRLFGDVGPDVRPVRLARGGGQAYASADGRRVAVHAPGLDVVVQGSLPARTLLALAADLGVRGRPVPAGWPEAATATPPEAAAALPGLLVPARGGGFAAPAVRVEAGTVDQVVSGAGDRGYALVQVRADHLPPPSDGDEVGVAVRGTTGRYSYDRGQLEWIEGGIARSLRSPTLGLAELVAVAESLVPA